MILHAGLIAVRVGGAWRGALIIGASGAGKSDLMLRAIDGGFRLVADDRTLVWRSGGRLFGRAPEPLSGLIELRGVGVVGEPFLPLAQIDMVTSCEPAGADLERVPDPAFEDIGGASVRLLRVHALDASAPAKLGRALLRLGRDGAAA